MAAERAQQDGYAARDRHPSDTSMPPNNGSNTATTTQQQHDSHHHHHHHRPADGERDLFLRLEQLEQQISWNYNAIRSHEDTLARFDRALGDFQHDVRRALDGLTSEIRSRAPAGPEMQGRYDQRDVDVLATQIATVTTKVHEIDNVRTQVELLKTKMKRLETETVSHSLQIPPRPSSATSYRETHDAPQHPPHAHPHQPLPPIHTGAAPAEHRSTANYHAPAHDEHRPSSGEIQYPPAGHRPGEPLPPPPTSTTLSGWRAGAQPPYPRSDSDPSATWSMNNSQGPKRPFEDPSPREHSAPASPKRPKLAPLMPRSTYGDEHPAYAGPDGLQYHRGPPHDVPPQVLTTPASATAAPNSFRFITASTPSEGPEPWRSDDGNLTPASARGRGRSARGGRARPRGSRGENGQEGGTPEWEQKGDWHAAPPQQQPSPNGYYNTNAPRPLLRPGEGPPEYPLTPIASAVSPQDHSLMPTETASGGKKTRTKPIRNSEGILIRKDGRPDMRSVSSANNLRKVHAKKEAEKAETDGRTPNSARSLAPAHSNSVSEDDEQSESQGVEASRSATPKTQADGEKTAERQNTSAPTSASTDSATMDRKSAPGGWYSSRDEPAGENKSSMLLDGNRRNSGEQKHALASKSEVQAAAQ